MPTLTWTGKEDALRAASLVPFRLLEPHAAAEGGIVASGAVVGDPKAAQDLRLKSVNDKRLSAMELFLAIRKKPKSHTVKSQCPFQRLMYR
jgi:hypothetical protein